MKHRLAIPAVALPLGYGVRCIIAGSYFLIPSMLALAVLLGVLVMRTPTASRP